MGLYGPYDTYDEFLLYADFDVYDEPEKPEPLKDHLDIVDEGDIEAVEAKYGCPLEEIDEEDLIDIVNRHAFVQGNVLSAEWNRAWLEIDYTYEFIE